MGGLDACGSRNECVGFSALLLNTGVKYVKGAFAAVVRKGMEPRAPGPAVSLNGVPMALNAAGMPPDGGRIEGRRTPNRGDSSHLALPALSSFFSVFSEAAAPACLAGLR